MNKIFQTIKMLSVFLVESIQNVYKMPLNFAKFNKNCKDFFSIVLNNKNNLVINIISYIFLCIIIYIIMSDLKLLNLFQIIIFSIMSFAINIYISDKFKVSKNKFIKILQKFVIINIIIALIALILYLLDVNILCVRNTVFCESGDESEDEINAHAQEEINKNEEESINNKDIVHVTSNRYDTNEEYYNFKLKKDLVDSSLAKIKEIAGVVVKDIGPEIGIGAAVGKVASEALKQTAGLPTVSKAVVVGTVAAVTAGGTKIGLGFGKSVLTNISIKNEIEASKLDTNEQNESNSPSDLDGGGGFIQSVLEDSEIPLITMVNGLSYLNYIEFSLILCLFSLLFRKYLNKKLKRLILDFYNKYIVSKNSFKEVESINDENLSLNKALNNLDKYTDYIIVYIFICLTWIKLINIYFSSYLAENIDSFVEVYNFLKRNSFYLLLTLNKIFKTKKKENKKLNYPFCKRLELHRKYTTIFNISGCRNKFKIPFSNNRNISTINKSKSSISSLSYDIDSPIFRKLLSLLTSNTNTKEVQLQIEQLLQNQALEIAKTKLSSQGESPHHNHINKPIILKLAETKPRLEKIINNYKSNLLILDSKLSSLDSKIIYNICTEFLIHIMYGRLLNIISNNQLLNNKTYQVEVTIDLGKELVNNYITGIYKKIKQTNPNITYIQWKEENPELINHINEPQFLFELGNLLINFMTDLKLIKSEVKVLAKDEKKSILVVGPALVKLIPQLETSFSIQSIPNRIPMVCPPKLYKFKENKYLELGGYLLNGEEYTDEIILSNWELSSKSTLLEENDIIDMVNKINSVAFKINENVLDFILLNNHKYGFFTETGNVNPLSLKNKLTMIEKRELTSFNSRKHLELNILGLATIFRDIPSIYLPVRIDYRGRLYCVTEYLNYQGIELAKGLLEFSLGEKVFLTDQEAIKYLKIFGANCFGNKLEKKSFLDRVAWIDNNTEDIINFDNGILLNKAENKTLFLSFCFEYKKYVEALNNNIPYFVSNLPIQLDASCNGFQHLTLLINEIALAKELNLNDSSWNDIPKDFYNFIAIKVKKYFVDKLEESRVGKLNLSAENKESYEKLAKLAIFRGLIKKAVMTIPYNASAASIEEYLKASFDKQKNPNFYDSELNQTDAVAQKENKYKDYYIWVLKSEISTKETGVIFKELDFKNLRKALNISIFIDYPKLTALAEYLRGIANVSNKLNIAIPWNLPSGLVINQQFYEKKTLKIKPFTYTKNLLNLTVLNKKQFNKNKQKIALMPNLIHSLDAASLCLVIVNYFKQIDNINFYSIHDCFAVPCNKVNNLTGLLKTAYCIIYSDSKYLLDFDASFRFSIIKSYGEAAVLFKDEEAKLIVKLNGENLTFKFPSINSVIQEENSKVNLKNSNYLIH